MTFSESASAHGYGSYDDGHYFAFVESSEALSPSLANGEIELPAEWRPVLDIRNGMGLGVPAEVMWLDCVRANYFSVLDWTDDECQIGNREHSNRRRKLLLELDSSEFKVAMLPIHPGGKGERDDFGRFNEMSWHLVNLSPQGGLPVLAGPDFDLDAGQREVLFVKHVRFLHETELKGLGNVFNLDFLPDAYLNGRERPNDNTPPRGMPPDPGRAKEIFIKRLRDVNWRGKSRYRKLN